METTTKELSDYETDVIKNQNELRMFNRMFSALITDRELVAEILLRGIETELLPEDVRGLVTEIYQEMSAGKECPKDKVRELIEMITQRIISK